LKDTGIRPARACFRVGDVRPRASTAHAHKANLKRPLGPFFSAIKEGSHVPGPTSEVSLANSSPLVQHLHSLSFEARLLMPLPEYVITPHASLRSHE